MPNCYGCGDGEGCACGSRRNVGGAGLLVSGFWVPSGAVVESSGVGWRRFKVGRPGVPSSLLAMAPLEDTRAFDNLNNLFLTRWNSEELMTYSSRSGKRAAKAIAEARRSAGAG
jgi:hypothetical protein